jgi:quercetin dioxygenase-like cupin family protein
VTEPNRREMLMALSCLSAVLLSTRSAAGEDVSLASSQVFSVRKLKAVSQVGGWETRQVMKGVTTTGEHLDIHQSTLPAGKMPHPPHQHRHAELMVLLEGNIEFYNGAVTETMQGGDLVYAAPNQLHGWKNVGQGPARYFVIAVGEDAK